MPFNYNRMSNLGQGYIALCRQFTKRPPLGFSLQQRASCTFLLYDSDADLGQRDQPFPFNLRRYRLTDEGEEIRIAMVASIQRSFE